jgi:hypothetical protein
MMSVAADLSFLCYSYAFIHNHSSPVVDAVYKGDM